MNETIEKLQNASARIALDIKGVNRRLTEFKKGLDVLDHSDPEALQVSRTGLSQLLTDICVIITSLTVFKKSVASLGSGDERYSLLPTKRGLLSEADEYLTNFRTVMYGLKEVSSHLRDSHFRLVAEEERDGN